jgi:hypothetical protein
MWPRSQRPPQPVAIGPPAAFLPPLATPPHHQAHHEIPAASCPPQLGRRHLIGLSDCFIGVETGFATATSDASRRPLWINRVDFATSALASAIHNTGHYHVRSDRSAWLLPAPELQTTGATAAAPAFCPRSTRRRELHLRSTKTRDINCAKSVRNLLASCLSWFCPMAVWRRIAKDR